MSRPEPIECIVMSAITSETKAGKIRKVTFMLSNDEPEHPFAGMIGERLHIIALIVQDDETTKPVALAGQGEDTEGNRPDDAQRASPEPKERKRWDELPPAQQAAIRCGEPEFWRFLAEHPDAPPGHLMDSAEAADEILKMLFSIRSKRELNETPAAWEIFENDYWAWRRDPRRSAA